jgi:hypothetical protein
VDYVEGLTDWAIHTRLANQSRGRNSSMQVSGSEEQESSFTWLLERKAIIRPYAENGPVQNLYE